jgi:uncharacterized protein YdaU (DUF1376 family)
VVKKAEYMHYYQFHIGDYKSHTHHLSLLEDLAYRRLLDFYFLHEKPIKHRDVARQIGMREHEEDVMTVLNEFFISTEDGFVSPRADKEIKQYKEFSEAGKRGAAKRWGTPPNGEAISPPNATPIATNNHKPITNNQIREKATSVATPIGVSDSVWQEFKTLRKAKKAPITQRAIDAIETEANKAGWTLEKALEECVVRGWQAFKADWVATKANPADIVRLTVPSSNEPDPQLLKIIADAKNAAPMPDFVRQFAKQVKKA